MVHHHDAGAVETLGLVDKKVAALVVHVVGNDKALWRVEEWINSLGYFVLCNIDTGLYSLCLIITINLGPNDFPSSL